MNRIGINYTYWTSAGVPMDFFELAKLTAKAGASVFETNPERLMAMESKQREDFKAYLQDLDLSIAFNSGLNTLNDISADEQDVRKIGMEHSNRILEFISEFGGTFWSGINYSAWCRRPRSGETLIEKARAYEYSVISMKEIIKRAEELGIVYAYEVVNRFEQFLFNTADDAIQYCKDVGSPNAKIMLDVFHMNIEEDDMACAISNAIKCGRLEHLHVCEANRRTPGTGRTHIDWKSIFSALKVNDYKGYISLESLERTGSSPSDACCIWRNLTDGSIETLLRNAQKAVMFIQKGLSSH